MSQSRDAFRQAKLSNSGTSAHRLQIARESNSGQVQLLVGQSKLSGWLVPLPKKNASEVACITRFVCRKAWPSW